MNRVFNKVKEFVLKIIPAYAILPLIITVAWNSSVYYGVRLLYGNRHFYDMTTALEEAIPVLPFTVIFYYCFFPFLVVVNVVLARIRKELCYQYVLSDIMAKTICLFIFLLIPTTNIRPDVTGQDVFSKILRMLYASDAANNLFPSIHCLDSWFCFVAVRNLKEVPKKYRFLILVVAVLICISTLTTKQHVMADVVSGIAMAEILWLISGRLLKTNFVKEKLKL